MPRTSVAFVQPEPPRNIVSSRLKKIRKQKGLTQDDLAARCDVLGFHISYSAISKIERGDRGLSDLEFVILCRALRVSLEELVPEELPEWRKDLRPPTSFEDEA